MGSAMRIESIDVYMGYAITVKVNTDTGLSGYGEAGLQFGNSRMAAFGQCQDFARMALGFDPMNTEALWNHLKYDSFWGVNGGPVVMGAISAIDTACWDIKGKRLSVPVYELLGGRSRRKLHAYASQIQLGWGGEERGEKAFGRNPLRDPQEYYDVTRRVISEGFDTVKVDPMHVPGPWVEESEWESHIGKGYRGVMTRREIQLVKDRVAAIREAGGPDLGIIIEAHSILDANTACLVGNALADFSILYFEEPTEPSNPRLFRYISSHCPIPLATGERCYTRWDFREFLEDHSLSIVQPDLSNTGGITETKKIADMAAVYDASVQLHVCGGPIATAASMQLEAVIPNFCIHEYIGGARKNDYISSGLYDYQPKDSYIDVPDIPGIGQEMSTEEINAARHVHIQ